MGVTTRCCIPRSMAYGCQAKVPKCSGETCQEGPSRISASADSMPGEARQIFESTGVKMIADALVSHQITTLWDGAPGTDSCSRGDALA